MKAHPFLIEAALLLALIGGIIGVRCEQTNAPIKLKSLEPVQPPAPPTPSFQEGVQFGLIARQRNQDVDDVRVLVQLAYRLWHQAWMQQQAIMAQQSAKTNVVSTNTLIGSTNETKANTEPLAEEPK